MAAEPDAIAVVEFATARTVRLAHADVRAVAAFDDQLWIATHDDRLLCTDRCGRVLSESVALPFAVRALLMPSSFGAAAAVWASSPAVAFIDDFGCLRQTELADVDMAIPITGRRVLVARGAKLVLPSGVTPQLAPNTTFVAVLQSNPARDVFEVGSKLRLSHLPYALVGNEDAHGIDDIHVHRRGATTEP